MSEPAQRGSVITFYSYKGGAGRSMALANVACLLADDSNDARPVLAIDWDLEAPGLHRFFEGRLSTSTKARRPGGNIDDHPGLIDLFYKLDAMTPKERAADLNESEQHAADIVDRLELDEYLIDVQGGNIQLIKAGRFDSSYATRVNTFGWESLHTRSPFLFSTLADRLAARFKYVLIDSRTGLTDTSGICTSLMPERLVTVFTPNRQSLGGVMQLVREAVNYRKVAEDERPLLIYPLPSRIESSREDLRSAWRYGNPARRIEGYQPQFEALFTDIYKLSKCSLQRYFDDVQIQQSQDYAYGEEIAALLETVEDRFSLKRSYKTFLKWIETDSKPWERVVEPVVPIEDVRAIEVKAAAAEETVQALTSNLAWARRAIAALAVIGVASAGLYLWNRTQTTSLNMDHWLESVALSSDGRYVAARRRNAEIRVWSTLDNRDVSTSANLVGLEVAFLPDSESLLVADGIGGKIWNVSAASVTKEVAETDRAFNLAAISTDGTWMAKASLDAVVLQNVQNPSIPPLTLTKPVGYVSDLAISADGRFLAAIIGNDLAVWIPATSSAPAYWYKSPAPYTFDVVFSPSGETLLVASNGKILRWDVSALARGPSAPLADFGYLGEIAYSPDGRLVAASRGDYVTLLKVDGDALTFETDLAGNKTTVRAVAFSSDGSKMATGANDGRLMIWLLADLSKAPQEFMFE